MSDNEKKAVRLPGRVRDDLRAYADEHDLTYSDALREILPDDVAEGVIDRGETVFIDIGPEAHEKLDALTGEGVDYGDVIAHYLREATEETSYT